MPKSDIASFAKGAAPDHNENGATRVDIMGENSNKDKKRYTAPKIVQNTRPQPLQVVWSLELNEHIEFAFP